MTRGASRGGEVAPVAARGAARGGEVAPVAGAGRGGEVVPVAARGAVRRLRAGLVALALVTVGGLLPAGAGAATGTCKTTTVETTVGAKLTLKLDCRVGRTDPVLAARGRARTTIAVKPTRGTLGAVVKRTGRVVYTARVAGRDVVRYRVRSRTGRTYKGAIVLRIAARPAPAPTVVTTPAPVTLATPAVTATPTPTPTATPDDGLPDRLPPVAASVASSTRAWVPAVAETCPAAVHDRYSVIGPDGRRYPTWHPPTTIDPATGRSCTFGHEHGDDPRTSDLFAWVSGHQAAPGYEAYAGLPFGQATEALDAFAAANPGTAKRSEDHVGYKVSVTNDVALLGPDGAATGTTCDYLTSVHQGSHSPDALSNNAHELVHAVRCTDGTELISTTVSRFGDPGVYERGCDPQTRIATVDNGYPAGPGARLIPDRECVERNVLVPPGRTTSVWALYEKWTSVNTLELPGGAPLATYETSFGVFNPSRYAGPGTTTARTLPLCWETTAEGRRADGVDCAQATPGTAFDDASSPFDGTRRDVYLAGTKVDNPSATRRWWTDPYGRNASPTPFPGGVCQLVSATNAPSQGSARTQVFGRNRSYDAEGVHAPN